MRYRLTPQEDAFRAEVAEWLARNLPKTRPPEIDVHACREADAAWQRLLYDAGYAGLAWPKEFGGAGLSPVEELIFQLELATAGAPATDTRVVGLGHAGPTLIAVGTDAQRARYLPPILKGEEMWSQGFSEPGSGSDLASLRTSGRVEGDHLVVNGQKIWTSLAQVSDFQELLVRTDPASTRHHGISWVICDMKAPGVTIRPIMKMTGLSHFCEVFYDDVRIPLANVVGGLNNGWQTAMVTLSFERGTHFIATQVSQVHTIAKLLASVNARAATGERTFLQRRLAALSTEAEALLAMSFRTIGYAQRHGNAGSTASLLKILTVDMVQQVAEIGLEIAGADALLASDELTLEWMKQYGHVFGGGTPEIQRNVIGERILGLPR